MKKILASLLVVIAVSLSVIGFAAELKIKEKQKAIDIVTFTESSLYRLLKIDPKSGTGMMRPKETSDLYDDPEDSEDYKVITSVASVIISKGSLDIKSVRFFIPAYNNIKIINTPLYKFYAGVSTLEFPFVGMDDYYSGSNYKGPIEIVIEMTDSWFDFTDFQKDLLKSGKSIAIHSSENWNYAANYLMDDSSDKPEHIMITATPKQ